MAATSPELSEAAQVERWREEVLLEAGYPAQWARVLAGRVDVDLHGAVALLADGCPLDVALEILI